MRHSRLRQIEQCEAVCLSRWLASSCRGDLFLAHSSQAFVPAAPSSLSLHHVLSGTGSRHSTWLSLPYAQDALTQDPAFSALALRQDVPLSGPQSPLPTSDGVVPGQNKRHPNLHALPKTFIRLLVYFREEAQRGRSFDKGSTAT